MPEGGNQVFNLPKDAKFTVDGKPTTAFDLRKGMKIEATVVTDEPQTLVASTRRLLARRRLLRHRRWSACCSSPGTSQL